MKGIFVTGTDTGVGKTIVVAALLRELKLRGLDAMPMKPVQTGWPQANDVAACGVKNTPLTNPYRFKLAASPHLAGRVKLQKIVRAFNALSRKHDFVVVEGAGGVLVPLNDKETMIDLIKKLRLPVVIVARAGLGTLNHTLLTLNELRRAGLRVAGIVLNQGRSGGWKRIEQDNLETLQKRGRCPVVRFLPMIGKNRSRNFQSLEKMGLA